MPAFSTTTTTVRRVVHVKDARPALLVAQPPQEALFRPRLLAQPRLAAPHPHIFQPSLVENTRSIRYEETVDSNGVRTQRYYDSLFDDPRTAAQQQAPATAPAGPSPVPIYGYRPFVTGDGVQPPISRPAAPRQEPVQMERATSSSSSSSSATPATGRNPAVSVGRPVSPSGWPWLRTEGSFDVYRSPDGSEVRIPDKHAF